MVELEKKYEIGVRRFGYVNWIGVWTLYKKEILRFLNVWIQTLLSPLISSLLFLLVISLAINDKGNVLGVPFINFLAPGLIAMQVIQQAFSHSSSSLMIGKIQGNIIDTLLAPLSALEVTLAIILAAVTRSIIITIISIIVFELSDLLSSVMSLLVNEIQPSVQLYFSAIISSAPSGTPCIPISPPIVPFLSMIPSALRLLNLRHDSLLG